MLPTIDLLKILREVGDVKLIYLKTQVIVLNTKNHDLDGEMYAQGKLLHMKMLKIAGQRTYNAPKNAYVKHILTMKREVCMNTLNHMMMIVTVSVLGMTEYVFKLTNFLCRSR